MINLIRIVSNFFFRNEIIKVYRFPTAKRFRAHLLGLTSALFFSLLYLVFNYSPIFSNQPWFIPVLTFLILITGTCFCWWTFLFILFILQITRIQIDPQIVQLYFWSYLSGALFAIIYNDLVYLYLWLFEKNAIKIVFAMDPRKKINIIKSPKINEETVALVPTKGLYDFEKSDAADFHPYTIVFWANKIFHDKTVKKYRADPISRDLTLFLRSVEKALMVFEKNEVLGRPEIWSNIRIITIFEGTEVATEGEMNFYAQSAKFKADGEPIENLITPAEDLGTKYEQFISNQITIEAHSPEAIKAFKEKVDVIYVLSAVEKFTRATALFADIKGFSDTIPIANPNGIVFDFAYVTYDIDNNYYKKIELTPNINNCIHDFYAQIPGRIAINVKTATAKTYIHELAHAMSSAWHGMIVDEYYDDGEFNDSKIVTSEMKKAGTAKNEIPFCVNRFIRQKLSDNKWLPIPHIFAVYNQTPFKSDLEHPSAKEKWIGYFPDRSRKNTICTMDASFCTYRFDDLIAAFMYDRLITKINRP